MVDIEKPYSACQSSSAYAFETKVKGRVAVTPIEKYQKGQTMNITAIEASLRELVPAKFEANC